MRITLLVLLVFSLLAHAGYRSLDFFEDETPLSMTLIAALDSVQADRVLVHTEAHNSWILVNQADKVDSLRGSIEVRGNFRKRPENCEWPPLKVKIKKTEAYGHVLGDNRKFKLVTNCQGENYLIREYLLYKMYGLITDCSYKVRLVDLTLRDATGLQPDVQQTGFLIEDKDDLAKRMNLVVAENARVSPEELALQERARLYLFQYMIGNLDWDIFYEKNVSVFRQGNGTIAVPYDFDFTGCVGAPYAELEDFERRYFRELCWDAEIQEEIRQEFLSLQPKWEAQIAACKHLESSDKKEMLRYFKPFFKALEDPKAWNATFPSVCK
ncbi:MAG: hypothetical protein NWR72_18725 [Bacteroidia bacterium]|nr:hypothetical protein [Bacteroidia bacterium]